MSKKTCFVNGCFDVLHVGHIKLFEFCKKQSDWLIVAIDSDERISDAKGKNRPINNLSDRAYFLESISYVDKVLSFSSDEELESLVKNISPEIMVVGSDWREKEVIGGKHAEELIFFDRIGNYSTTNILKGKISWATYL